MNCFNHPTEPAVGLCKSCCKALCRGCIAELENGLACKGTNCEERVELINRMIDNNKRIMSVANTQNRFAVTMAFGMGAAFCAFGVVFWIAVNKYVGMFTGFMGVVMLVAGFRRLRAGANFPQIDSAARDGKEVYVKEPW